MKKIDKLIFATITLAWLFPIVFFYENWNRWFVYNALLNSLEGIVSIIKNLILHNQITSIENTIYCCFSFVSMILFVIYFVRFIMNKQLKKFVIVLECFCSVMFGYRLFNVIRFASYGEFYPPYAIALEILAIVLNFISLALTIYNLIKHAPRHPTKAERLQSQIDELQKQVDELKDKDN